MGYVRTVILRIETVFVGCHSIIIGHRALDRFSIAIFIAGIKAILIGRNCPEVGAWSAY